jgi:hypothetical protein
VRATVDKGPWLAGGNAKMKEGGSDTLRKVMVFSTFDRVKSEKQAAWAPRYGSLALNTYSNHRPGSGLESGDRRLSLDNNIPSSTASNLSCHKEWVSIGNNLLRR